MNKPPNYRPTSLASLGSVEVMGGAHHRSTSLTSPDPVEQIGCPERLIILERAGPVDIMGSILPANYS